VRGLVVMAMDWGRNTAKPRGDSESEIHSEELVG
jgi:predicted alpha-1,6-mannanase (GH76 family)